MPDVPKEQAVTGEFAEELPNPKYGFQDEEASTASAAIVCEPAEKTPPLQLVQAKQGG